MESFLQGQTTETLTSLARLAETAERYEDMCVITKELIDKKGPEAFTTEERSIFSVAFKNVVSAKRASWRALRGNEVDADTMAQYQNQIETEIEETCKGVIGLIEAKIFPRCGIEAGVSEAYNPKGDDKHEDSVFYIKMAGDYCRYIAEIKTDAEEEYKMKAVSLYARAMKIAEAHLSMTNPTRLGLALNFSVCCFEIVKDHDKAKEIAKKAFTEALQSLDSIGDEQYRDSTLIMQLLRDNLSLWETGDENQENGA